MCSRIPYARRQRTHLPLRAARQGTAAVDPTIVASLGKNMIADCAKAKVDRRGRCL